MKRILVLALILLATVTTMASAVEIMPIDPGTCEIITYPYPTEIGIPLPLDRYKVKISGVIHIGDPITTRIITDLAVEIWQRAEGDITALNVCCQAIDGTVCHAITTTTDILK